TDEKPASEITLLVYAGADGNFELYEDEGTTYDYERGKFSIIAINYNDDTGELRINDRQGNFDGMLNRRASRTGYIYPDAPQGIDTPLRITKTVTYTGKEARINLKK